MVVCVTTGIGPLGIVYDILIGHIHQSVEDPEDL